MAEVRLYLDEANGNLPGACMCCGEQATTAVTRKMSWCPSWIAVFIIFGLLPYAILALIMTRKATVIVPLCDEHKNHWSKRTLWILLSALGFTMLVIAVFVVLAVLPGRIGEEMMPFAAIFAFVLFLVWIVIIAVAQSSVISTKEITNSDILLSGVSENFVEIMHEIDREHQKKRAILVNDDETDDRKLNVRRRKTPPSEDIRE